MRLSSHTEIAVPPRGLFFLTLTVLCGGMVLGGLAWILGQIVWIALLFPFGLSMMAGGLLMQIINKYVIAHPRLALVAGLGMGGMIYGTYHYAEYLMFLATLRDVLRAEGAATSLLQHDQAIDTWLRSMTGSTGFWGYLQLLTQKGITLGHIGLGGSFPVTLNQPLSWLYLLFELGIIGGGAAFLAHGAAQKPFCRACQHWFHGAVHLGSIPADASQSFLEAIQHGRFFQAGTFLQDDYHDSPSVEVYLQSCAREQEHPSILTMRYAVVTGQGTLQFTDIFEGMMTANETHTLLQGQQSVPNKSEEDV